MRWTSAALIVILAVVCGSVAASRSVGPKRELKGYGEGRRLSTVVYNQHTEYIAAVYVTVQYPAVKGTIPPEPCGNFVNAASESYITVGQTVTKSLSGEVNTSPCLETKGTTNLTIQLTVVSDSAGGALAEGTALVNSINSGAFGADLAKLGLVGYKPLGAKLAGVTKSL